MSRVVAVTVFHRTVDDGGFDCWAAELIECARAAEGFVEAATSLHESPELEWAIAVTFAGEKQLHVWLDGDARATAIADGTSRGFWPKSVDLVIAVDRRQPSGVGVFLHPVAAGREAEFVETQVRLAVESGALPGCEGNAVFGADSTGQWMSVVRFRTAPQLAAWLRSSARLGAISDLRANLTKDFTQGPYLAPFGATVRTDDPMIEITPGWKVAMLVLLAVFPTVMLLSRFLGPVLAGWGLPPWLTLWLSQLTSTALLQWAIIPVAWRGFRRWMDPVDGAGVAVSLRGAAAIVGLYVLTLLVFATVKELQFWDYMD